MPLLIVHKAGSALGFYDLEGKHETSVPVGTHPHELVLSADCRLAYVTDNGAMRVEHPGRGGHTVSIVDLKERRRTGEIDLGEFHRPHGIALDPATGRLAVTTELPDHLLLIDPVERKVLRTYETRGRSSHMVCVSPDGNQAYVCNARSESVAAIDLAAGGVELIHTGGRPETAVLSRDGTRLYVANLDADNITVIDTAKRAVVDRIPTGKGPVRLALTPDESQIVHALIHGNGIEFIDLAARRVTCRLDLDGSPVSLNLSPGGRLAYASLEEEDSVWVASVTGRRLLRKFQTQPGAGPDPVFHID